MRLLYCVLPPSPGAADCAAWLRGMPENRRVKAEAYRRSEDVLASCAVYALLCMALQEAGLGYLRPVLTAGCNGKPYIEPLPWVHCNLSHSGAVVACALSDAPVGVDVQAHRAVEDSLARRVMSDSEYAHWRGCDDPQSYFFAIWTLKESYSKYTGRGLGESLQQCSFLVGQSDASLIGNEALYFTRFAPADGYSGALCSGHALRSAPVAVEYQALLSFWRESGE